MLVNKPKKIIVLSCVLCILSITLAFWASRSLAGDDHTYSSSSQNKYSFSSPPNDLSPDELMQFAAGRSLFKKLWIAAPATTKSSDGLGPLYNARSCFQCHINAGRGQVPDVGKRAVSLFMRLSIPPQNDNDKSLLKEHKQAVIAEPNYGTQFQNFAVTALAGEGELQVNYTDVPVVLAGGETVVLHKPDYKLLSLQYGELHKDAMMSPRLAPQLVGMGILDTINEQDILSLSDVDDQNSDGISGKPNRVWSQQFNKVMLGRFGYKAGVATLNEQNQRAFVGDIGLSTPLFPTAWGDCTKHQQRCQKAPNGNSASQQNLEASKKVTDAVLFYMSNLSIPQQKQSEKSDVIIGKQTFITLGCANCHRPNYQIDKQTVSPYTDLLLHDMGDGLADNRPEGDATGKEWRTAPLWGIGLTSAVNGHNYFLHDGRARTIQEAILWHGGEAQKARDRYAALNKEGRQALIRFLTSL